MEKNERKKDLSIFRRILLCRLLKALLFFWSGNQSCPVIYMERTFSTICFNRFNQRGGRMVLKSVLCKSVQRLDETTGGSLNFILRNYLDEERGWKGSIGGRGSDNDRCTHTITRNLSHLSRPGIVDGYVLAFSCAAEFAYVISRPPRLTRGE